MTKKTKRIQIHSYPATFEFTIRTELPPFDNDSHLGLSDSDYEDENFVWEDRKNYKAEQVRKRLLLRYLNKLKIHSPCHAYGDYVVERVTETPDGEIWQLGS
jgi:hypothetical protein